MTRRLFALAAACVVILWGVAVALGWATLLDVLAVASVVAWTGGTGYVGWWIARRGEADRLDEAIDIVLDLRERAHEVDIDALRAAVKEDR